MGGTLTRATGAALFGVAMILASCNSYVVRPEVGAGAPDPALVARAAKTRVSYEVHGSPGLGLRDVPERALQETLDAIGTAGARRADAAQPGWLHLSVHILPRDTTCVYRCVGLPWALLTLATLGLVPHVEQEAVQIEINAVVADPSRRGVRTVRGSATIASTMGWFARRAEPGDRLAGANPREHALRVALRRVFEAALAEILTPVASGSIESSEPRTAGP